MSVRKRKPIWLQMQNEFTSKRKWNFYDIAQDYECGNCTCGRCVTEALMKSEDREKANLHQNGGSAVDVAESSSSVYSFGKDEGPTACTCIFCSTQSYTASCEEVLKDQMTKLGKENIPSCKTTMLHPERKFFRYASVREKRSARAKNEPANEGECSPTRSISYDVELEEYRQETDEWSIK